MVSIPAIVVMVADTYGLEPSALSGRGRTKEIYTARSHAISVAFNAGFTVQEIGTYFKRDQTSIHAALGAYLHHRRRGDTRKLQHKGEQNARLEQQRLGFPSRTTARI